MKNIFKKAVAITVAATMVASSTVAFAQADSALAGTGTVISPTYSVLLPTVPVVRVNAFELGGADQVSSPVYVIANRSNVDVQVTMTVNATTTAAAGATYVNEASELADDDTKQAFLYVQFASGITGELTNTATAVQASAANWTFRTESDAIEDSQVLGLAATVQDASVLYLILNAHEYDYNATTGAGTIKAGNMNNNQFVAYTFGGAVNTFAPWAANNVAARIVFSFDPIKGGDVADYRSDSDALGSALNVFTTFEID